MLFLFSGWRKNMNLSRVIFPVWTFDFVDFFVWKTRFHWAWRKLSGKEINVDNRVELISDSRISTRSWLGVLGVAGTLLAFLLSPVVWQRCIAGSSVVLNGADSSSTSLSVRPVYLNLVPHENIDPPLTTGASEALGNLTDRKKKQRNLKNTFFLLRIKLFKFGSGTVVQAKK